MQLLPHHQWLDPTQNNRIMASSGTEPARQRHREGIMSNSSQDPFLIAAVQATPVFLDRDATLEKAIDLIAEAGRGGAKLAVFPECFIPTYPLWAWFISPYKTHDLRDLYTELLENAVSVPSEATDRLCRAAAHAGVNVVMGVNERNVEASGTTVYNTLLFIDADGHLLGKHRKLVPTVAERLVHAQGDGSTLRTYDLSIGRLAGLICWENTCRSPGTRCTRGERRCTSRRRGTAVSRGFRRSDTSRKKAVSTSWAAACLCVASRPA